MVTIPSPGTINGSFLRINLRGARKSSSYHVNDRSKPHPSYLVITIQAFIVLMLILFLFLAPFSILQKKPPQASIYLNNGSSRFQVHAGIAHAIVSLPCSSSVLFITMILIIFYSPCLPKYSLFHLIIHIFMEL